jgi:uncharacterized protein YcbX
MASHTAGSAGTIKNIWRYAVKSTNPESLDGALVNEGGILGDRAYALIDKETGKVASAKMPKKWGKLLDLSSAYVAQPEAGKPLPDVRITWPSGESVESSGDANARLSDYVGRPVTLTTTKPDEVSLERLDPLETEETILDIGEIMMEGRFSDYAALHLITTATIAKLAELSPEISFDVMRFRPNLLIDAPGVGFVENAWVGKTVAIGDDIRLRISDPTPRCAIPTLAQAGGVAKDPKVLRTIVTHNRLPVPLLDNEELPCAGVYAFVEQGGAMKKGDTVRVI